MSDRPTDKVNFTLDAQWYGESPQSKFNYLSLIATEKIIPRALRTHRITYKAASQLKRFKAS